MKRIIIIKPILAILTIAVFAIVFKSCKKVDNNGVNKTKTIADAIKEKYGGAVSSSIITPINKQADEVFYKDAAGKPVTLYSGGLTAKPNLCLGNCNTTTNPANVSVIFTLDYSERFYLCEGNSALSNVRVKWTVSVPFLLVDLLGKPPHFTGLVRFKNAGGAVINTYTVYPGFTNSSVKMIGPDPACSWNSLWEVTYNVTQIPNSDFLAGNTVEAAVELPNDCPLFNYYIVSGYVAGPAISQNGYLPCNRLDAVFFNPSSGPTSPSTVTGLYTTICLPPPGMQDIDFHQVEYRQVTTTNGDYTWENQGSTVQWGSPLGTGAPFPNIPAFNGQTTLNGMVEGTGKWLIRYRNVKTGTCNTLYAPPVPPGFPNANWGDPALWNTEMWDML